MKSLSEAPEGRVRRDGTAPAGAAPEAELLEGFVGRELELIVPGVPRRTVRVRSSRRHGRALLVGLEGFEDRDRAEELRGGREVGALRRPQEAGGDAADATADDRDG